MPSIKVLQLMKKYADEVNQPTVLLENSKNHYLHEQMRLNEFSHSFEMKLKIIISELEHDISTLKERKFDKEMLKLLVEVWNNITNISLSLSKNSPYISANKLIDYVNSKRTKDIIDNLDFLAQHHLKGTNESFIQNMGMKNPEIKGLKFLLNLVSYLENYMKENPLLEKVKPDPKKEVPIWRPPATDFDSFEKDMDKAIEEH
jgi:formate dehydrogenase maturation protein FdhE